MPPDRAQAPVAFLTGAAGGIGRALVERLRSEGYRIHATDLALAALPCVDGGFRAASLDVTDEAAVDAAIEACRATFGRIDHVIHLAGATGSGPLESVSRADWQRVLHASYEDFCGQVDEAEAGGQETLFDPYAAENPGEFFAVISEAFFESPGLLRAQYPTLYEQFAAFYRQDPAARRLPASELQ